MDRYIRGKRLGNLNSKYKLSNWNGFYNMKECFCKLPTKQTCNSVNFKCALAVFNLLFYWFKAYEHIFSLNQTPLQ